MSAKRQPQIDRRRDRDPYDLIPEGFCRAWGATTIAEALKNAEQAPSSTPDTELIRCPECHSSRITPKAVKFETHAQREIGQWRCLDEDCGMHFDEPTTLADEGQTGLDEFGGER